MGIPKTEKLNAMQTLVISSESFTVNQSTYFNVELEAGKQAVNVMIVTGAFNYLNVQVKNAMHRVWKGGGKQFNTSAAAIENYKSAEIKAAIKAAAELASI